MEKIEDLFGKQKEVKESVETAGHRERVRESINRNPDFSGFGDYEMLEYLLFATISRKDTKPIAKELIRTFGSLSAVLHADYYELVRMDGIGEKTAHLLANVLPIVIRAENMRYDNLRKITTAQEAAKYLYTRFYGKTKECLIMVSLNINDEVIQTDDITVGGVDAAPVDIMKILRVADRNGAKQIILAHNHPGGTMMFSEADIESTAQIVSGCSLTGFAFVDHLIFCGNKYLSMFGNDMFTRVIDLCDQLTSELSDSFTKERALRTMRMRLGECGSGRSSNEYKLQTLSAYKKIFRLNNEEFENLALQAMQSID